MKGRKPPGPPFAPHAAIINEYDWLWLHRDGTPTVLAQKVYDHLLGKDATRDQRVALNAYLLAGLTEFWRAHRQYAGVMYLAYLDADLPYAFTCDNFQDVQRLELEPHFADYIQEAFKPLGVYVNFWQPELPAGGDRRYRVMMVNDAGEPAKGRLELLWEPESGGPAVARTERPFEVPAIGQASYEVPLATPTQEGRYLLKVSAFWDGKPWSPTMARRKVSVTPGPVGGIRRN